VVLPKAEKKCDEEEHFLATGVAAASTKSKREVTDSLHPLKILLRKIFGALEH
jgi:hypothetical protein